MVNYNGNAPGVIHHVKTSRRLIRQAVVELEQKGDRVQASDKASGAVAHAVKAVAEARHWHHDSHNRRRRIVDLLAAEYDAPEWNLMQDSADKLHDNFYEDLLFEFQIQARLNLVTELLASFIELLEREPNPDFAPTADQELMVSRLRLTDDEIAERALIDYPPALPEVEEGAAGEEE